MLVTIQEGNKMTTYKAMHIPLWWQVAKLQQTSTGYGVKLSTEYMILRGKRLQRIYSMCFSNCSTEYIISKGQKVIINWFH